METQIFNLENCPKVAGIYKINFPNEKCYIGLSNNIPRRIKEHEYDTRQPVLYAAIKKYFPNGKIPNFEILEIIPADNKQTLLEKEHYYVQLYQSDQKDKGYNLTAGGNLYGIYNSQGKFSEEDIQNIYDLLKEKNYTMYKIAEMYEVSRRTIEEINKGSRYFHTGITYPIRTELLPRDGVHNSNAKFSEETIQSIIWDLQNTYLEYTDLAEKYNCHKTTIGKICRGESYRQEGLNYPLRQKNNTLNHKLYNKL